MPVNELRGPVLSGYPLLSSHVAKFQKFHNINTIKVTFIERPPPLSGQGTILIVVHCIKQSMESYVKGE